LLVKFTIDTFFPSPTPTALPTADIAERWKELAPLPEARQGMAAVAFDGNIYTLAGKGPDGVSGSVFRYLPEEDRWETLSDKPTPVTDVEGVVIGEKVYIPGGETVDGKPTDILEIYDPRQDTWETGTPLPQALSAYALADFEGKMYLFGGWDGEDAVDSVWIYEPISGDWEKGAKMQIASQHASAVMLTKEIVVLGGHSGDKRISSVYAFYPSRDNLDDDDPWVDLSGLPEGRYDFGAATLGDSIYIFGGMIESENKEDLNYSGYIFYNGNWQSLETIKNFNNLNIKTLLLNSMLYILESNKLLSRTSLWVYRALLYDIYIPYLP
jgi:hypothetical protein